MEPRASNLSVVESRRDKPLSSREEALIRALFPAILELTRRCDADLVREHGMSQTEYRVLQVLSEAEGRRVRMSDLAAACHQSLSAVSRTVGRLEKDALVRREQSASDARSAEAVLTSGGLERLQTAWPTHLRSVRRAFLDHLEGFDVSALARSLERIAAGVDANDEKDEKS
jgi:DNA-binding MarR family transcriptional regulator